MITELLFYIYSIQLYSFIILYYYQVRSLASEYLKEDPIQINIGSLDLSTNNNITQTFQFFDTDMPESRQELLRNELIKIMQNKEKALVFVATKRECNMMTGSLRQCGINALCIHGDKTQNERDWVLNDFKNNKIPILLATDVAARGIDVKDINKVINYDMPQNIEDYVHRIGRTGCAGAKGESISYYCPKDSGLAKKLVDLLSKSNTEVPNKLKDMIPRNNYASKSRYRQRGGGGYGGGRGGGTINIFI